MTIDPEKAAYAVGHIIGRAVLKHPLAGVACGKTCQFIYRRWRGSPPINGQVVRRDNK